jgi:flagellar basal-body rod modification protein FlgD
MAVYGLENVASRGGQITATSNDNVMGKDDFLHLLVAQLKAQDPLNPMDSTGFTAQLAQFSSLEQLQNINIALGTMGTSQSVMTSSQAVGFIGKTITAIGDTVEVQSGQSQGIEFSLDQPAAGLYIQVYDQMGNFVRQIEVGQTAAGEQRAAWDGLDYLGGRVPDGAYTYEVAAIDEFGNSVSATTFASGTVTGVSYKDGVAYLQCGSREIAMGNVVSVGLPADQQE